MTDTAQLTPNQKCYPLCIVEIELNTMKEIYAALSMHKCSEKMKMYAVLCMHTCSEKNTFLGKDNLIIVGGAGNAFKKVYPARAYPALVVLVH